MAGFYKDKPTSAAPLVTDSLMKYWPEEVKAHMEGRCPAGECKDE